MTESLLLASFGGCAGMLVAFAVMHILKLTLPPFYLPAEAVVSLDVRALFFTGGLILLAGILFGIAPALQAMRVNPIESLKEGNRSATTSAAGQRLRGILIVSEVALAFMLLTGAGLLLRSFYQLQQLDPGFDSTNVVNIWLPMDDKQYTNGDQINGYYQQILDRVRSVPGVRHAAIASSCH